MSYMSAHTDKRKFEEAVMESEDKKTKTDQDACGDAAPAATPASTVHATIKNLAAFRLKEVLSESVDRKKIAMKGSFEGHEGEAVLLLEKTAFERDHIEELFTAEAAVKRSFENDVYGKYKVIAPHFNQEIAASVIHPAKEKDIERFLFQRYYLVTETPEMYKEVTLPHLMEKQLSLQWVYNILDGLKEQDRVIFEDKDEVNGFMMVPDMKCHKDNDINCVYMLAIAQARDIKSLRDLTPKHLPLLKNILENGTGAMKKKFDLNESDLRIYFHYSPSFYHLHVHFVNLRFEAPGIHCERSHILQSVIRNIELCPDYYQKAHLPMLVREKDALFQRLVEYGALPASCGTGGTNQSSSLDLKKELDSIFIEHRLRLGSSHIHLNFKTTLPDSARNDIFVSTVSSNSFNVKLPGYAPLTITCKSINFQTNSVSSLTMRKNSISFRMQTKPESNLSGSTSSEVIVPSKPKFCKPRGVPAKRKDLVIMCRHCGSTANDGVFFDRVMPLPSNSWKEVEWFCHPDHSSTNLPGKSLLVPSDCDCFYSIDSTLIHISWLYPICVFPKTIRCQRCDTELGLREDDTARLWNYAIVWEPSSSAVISDHNEPDVDKILEFDLSRIIQKISSQSINVNLLIKNKQIWKYLPPKCVQLHVLPSPLRVSVLRLDATRPSSGSDLVMPDTRPAITVLFKEHANHEELDLPDGEMILPEGMILRALELLQESNALYPSSSNSTEGLQMGFIYCL